VTVLGLINFISYIATKIKEISHYTQNYAGIPLKYERDILQHRLTSVNSLPIPSG